MNYNKLIGVIGITTFVGGFLGLNAYIAIEVDSGLLTLVGVCLPLFCLFGGCIMFFLELIDGNIKIENLPRDIKTWFCT